MVFQTEFFSMKNGEKFGENGGNPVHEKWRKIRYTFSKRMQVLGGWRSNHVVPDVPADNVGRPTRLGKLVELLLTKEACRTWAARQEERGNFFLQKCSPPATRRTWWLLAAMRCVKVLNPA